MLTRHCGGKAEVENANNNNQYQVDLYGRLRWNQKILIESFLTFNSAFSGRDFRIVNFYDLETVPFFWFEEKFEVSFWSR